MKNYRENPEGEANVQATRQAQREIFALKMMEAQANQDKEVTRIRIKKKLYNNYHLIY